jgi:hypothetical protein
VVSASRCGGAHFGELDDLQLTLPTAPASLLHFVIEDAGPVSACIFGELYRRGGEWKLRAVGQGYDAGLAGLATDFGVDIENDAAAEEALDDAVGEAQTDTTGPKPAAGREPQATLEAIPAPRQPDEDAEPRKPPALSRTARKKVTLPKATHCRVRSTRGPRGDVHRGLTAARRQPTTP